MIFTLRYPSCGTCDFVMWRICDLSIFFIYKGNCDFTCNLLHSCMYVTYVNMLWKFYSCPYMSGGSSNAYDWQLVRRKWLTAGEKEVTYSLWEGSDLQLVRRKWLTAGEEEVALVTVQWKLSKFHGSAHNCDITPAYNFTFLN